ncbi:MAG TPA: TIGR03557 family F420-dependent LLM class oxidoreductase [Friedmanniella sp.]
MVRFGYTLMTEQSGPKQIVEYGARAEQVGFDFEVSSDHYSPWLTSQGHAGYAWTMLGAVAALTSSVELMTYVTCPTVRYHPAVVAQKAATLQIISDGRFTLGLGSGENLNEHITGEGWPPVAQRQDMLEEAVTIIRELLTGELVTWEGDYFRIDSARIWDTPDGGVPIGLAVSGPKSIERFAPLGDHLIAVEPDANAVKAWDKEKGGLLKVGADRSRKIGQIPICWGVDKDAAIAKAHDQFRWFGGGWAVNADLPTPAGFAAASQFVRPEDVAGSIPCGPDLDAIVEAVSAYWDAGFTDVAVVQVGDEGQREFLETAAAPLLAALRDAAPQD